MECKMGLLDVLTTNDIDLLIGNCMRPIQSGTEDTMVTKNETSVEENMEYTVTELVTNLNPAPNNEKSNTMYRSERQVDFEESYMFSSEYQNWINVEQNNNFYGNSPELQIRNEGYYQTWTSPTQSHHMEDRSMCINSEPQPQSKQPMKKKGKRFRTAFTARQMLALEREYQSSQYLGKVRRAELAMSIGLSEQTIKTWFQNRRMKTKREGKEQKSPKHSPCDLYRPSSKPYGDIPWTVYANNCAMQLQHQQYGNTDVKQTVSRW